MADDVCFGSEFVELSGGVAGVDADGVGRQMHGVLQAGVGDGTLGADGSSLS